MKEEVLIPLLVGIVSFISAGIFRFLPLGENREAFRHGIFLNELITGTYFLIVALLSAIFKFDMLTILYSIFGIFVIGFITMIPTVIKMTREPKTKTAVII